MIKIVFLDTGTFGDDYSFSEFPENTELIRYSKTKPTEVVERCKDAEVIITNKVIFGEKEFRELPKLKLIVVAATGTNNIEKESAAKHGVEVKNVKGYSTPSVVQHTIAMVFNLMHPMDKFKEFTQEGRWINHDFFNHAIPFNELNSKKWGIIGLGTIGYDVAQVARAFGCDVSYYSTSGKNKNQEFRQVDLKDLVMNSDIITIHCPLNDDTKDLIALTDLQSLKKGAIVINVGRGSIINEEDLAEYLSNDPKAIFGLDVISVEPMESDNPLVPHVRNKNLLLTPHVAWSSSEALERLEQGIKDNITQFILNK